MASHTCKKLFVFISSRVLFQTMFCGDGHLGFHIHKFELLHSCSLSGPCQTMFFGGGGGHLGFQIGTKITSLVEISLDITCLMYWCGMTSQKKLFVCTSRSVLFQTVLWWCWSSWISDRHQYHKFGRDLFHALA